MEIAVESINHRVEQMGHRIGDLEVRNFEITQSE